MQSSRTGDILVALPRHAILRCMEIDASHSRSSRRGRPWVEVTLITGFVMSLLIGIGALAALFVSLRGEEPALTASALETINPAQIVPQLALAQLAGEPAEALAYQALAAGELATAQSIALMTTDLDAPQRLTLLLRIGDELLARNQDREAVPLLNSARSPAILSPKADFGMRTNALTEIAIGLQLAGEDSSALDAAKQAMRAAEQTPGILPAHRSQAYENLQPIARELHDSAFNQELAELARNPYYEPAGILIEPRLSALPLALSYDPDVTAAISEREQAARVLVDRIALTGGIDIAPETQALGATLLREDQVRSAFYRRSLDQGLSLEGQYALLVDKRNWTALKLRVARKGFALSLVPQWEQDPSPILQELGADTANVGLVAEALSNEVADDTERAMMRMESVLWLAQQAEADLYPGASIVELNDRLQASQSELAGLGSSLALPIAYEDTASPPGFRIQSVR